MELTDKEIHLLAQLSRGRGLYAECKGAGLEALQRGGLLLWFDARSSSTPFREDPRPLFRLLLMNGRVDYFWIEPVENWRELVGPEASAKVDAFDEVEWGGDERWFQSANEANRRRKDREGSKNVVSVGLLAITALGSGDLRAFANEWDIIDPQRSSAQHAIRTQCTFVGEIGIFVAISVRVATPRPNKHVGQAA